MHFPRASYSHQKVKILVAKRFLLSASGDKKISKSEVFGREERERKISFRESEIKGEENGT